MKVEAVVNSWGIIVTAISIPEKFAGCGGIIQRKSRERDCSELRLKTAAGISSYNRMVEDE